MTLITAGPSRHAITLAAEDAFAPPIASGDLTRYVDEGHTTIMIIDGVFDQSLAITVAEIRECIRRGASVFGSTSMGALRAVEAAPVGMIGLGSIYSLIRRGKIVSDAELALSFTTEHKAVTVPLINIRHLCRHLIWATGNEEQIGAFFKKSQDVHFSERTFNRLGEVAQGISKRTFDVVSPFLSPGSREWWDVKALDAAAAVSEMKIRTPRHPHEPAAMTGPVPISPNYLLIGSPL